MHAFSYIAPDGSEWSVDVDRNGPYLAIEATREGASGLDGLPITETVDTALPEMEWALAIGSLLREINERVSA
jgi:hypothetical protein